MSTEFDIEEEFQTGEDIGSENVRDLIVYNDDFNTFDHVIVTLMTYIPGVTSDRASDFADQIHHEGQAIVWTGPLEQAALYHEQLRRAGLTMAPLEKA